MKKILIFFIAGVAIAALSACNNPLFDEGTEINPVQVDDMIALSEDLAQLVSTVCRDIRGEEGCIMINSMEELPEVDYLGNPISPPAIDFNSHTLVIGAIREGGGGWVLSDQSVVVGSKDISLRIRADRPYSGIDIPVIAGMSTLKDMVCNADSPVM